MNCVPCALAADSWLGGRPASALHTPMQSIMGVEAMYGETFQPVAQANLVSQLATASVGSRGIVLARLPNGSWHMFNMAHQRSGVVILDAQRGLANNAVLQGLSDFHWLRTN